jgi:hypothetical protein
MRPGDTFWRNDVELIPQSKPLVGRKGLTGDTHYVDGGFHIIA